tara:strand:- start:636 stop:1835 length:1200 start_codon:yes stop_codon:yes gene_type:complete
MSDIMKGIRVVSTESWGVVPAATAMMADMGAEVIKVEPPGVGDYLRQTAMRDFIFDEPPPLHPIFVMCNRGKKAITLDVRKEEGRLALIELIKTADVFATNLRPTFMEKNKLRYEDLQKINPRLVYATFNGYGEHGAEKDRLALGPTALWSRAGFAAHFGEPGEPPHVDRPTWDDSMATLGLMNGILAAMYEREKSGVGQKVAVNHYHVGVYINAALIQGRLSGAKVVKQMSNDESPLRSYYQCNDERWVLISCLNDAHWASLCTSLERPDLLQDDRFGKPTERASSGPILGAIIAEEFAKFSSKEIMNRLSMSGTICEMAYEVDDIIADPIAHQNGFFADVETDSGTFTTVTAPMSFSRTPTYPRGPAPEMGQHTEELLLEAGYTWEDISRMRDDGAI